VSEGDVKAAQQLLLKLHPEHPEVTTDLCAFTAGSDPFPASLLSPACTDRMSPVLWWTVKILRCHSYFQLYIC